MTIKSKAFKFLLGIAVVLGVAVSASLASAADFGTATLRVGSRGAAVMEVQKLVGVTADGAFGPMTEAAVKVWQANVGLYADGIFGPASMAKAYELAGSTGAVASGDLCPNGMTLASNCTVAPGTTTPVSLCPNGMTLASNCTVAPGGAVAPVVTTGEEADISFNVVEEDDIAQDGKNQHAFTIEIEADKNGGDAKIERLDFKLVAKDTTAPAKTLNSYRVITGVALEIDGDEIAQLDSDSRSDWRGDNNDIIRFSGLDIVVKSGKTVKVAILLDVKDDKIDEVVLEKLDYRWTDGTGITETGTKSTTPLTYTVGVKTPDSVDMRITRNSSSPKDSTLDVSSSRSNDRLVIADVEVKKGEGTLEDVKVEVEFVGAKNIDDVKSLVSRFALNVDGKQVDTVSSSAISTFVAGTKKVLMTFDAGELDFEEDDEFEIEVLASFRAYDKDATKTISAVQIASVTLEGYDSLKDTTFSETNTFTTPKFTITEGDITVSIDDSTVAVGAPLGTGTDGQISFEVTVKNETGSALEDMTTGGTWSFDVKGYGGITTTSVTFEEGDALKDTDGDTDGDGVAVADDLADGDEATFKVVLKYTQKVTNQPFTIEVTKIAGKSIGYVWKD